MEKLALREAFFDAKDRTERTMYYYAGKVSTPSSFQLPEAKDITHALEDTYFNIGRILYDPNFFEFSTKDSNQGKYNIISKAGTAFQNMINNKLSAKNAAGDYAPKASTKILLRIGEESLLFLGKNAAYIIPRIATSPAFLYAACIGGALTCLADDTTRTMLMEQVNHLTSVFSGNSTNKDNGLAKDFATAQEVKNTPFITTPKQVHKPACYI